MTFDEFLLSNENKLDLDDISVIKVNYNDNVIFIYKSGYYKLEYNTDLKFIGMFEKNKQKLYGSSFEFSSAPYSKFPSKFYHSDITSLTDEIYKKADILLSDYIEKNKEELKSFAKPIFDKYISFKYIDSEINSNAIKKYIYNEKDIGVKFSTETKSWKSKQRDLIMNYIQNPETTVEKVFNDYINNEDDSIRWYEDDREPYKKITTKESIGVRLLEEELKQNIIKDFENNPNNEHKKKHDIVTALKDFDAQNVNVTIQYKGKELTFKYSKQQLVFLYTSDWNIPDVHSRDEVKELYSDKGYTSDFDINDIVSISYRKQVLYEDKELLNEKENTVEINDDYIEMEV